MNSPKNKFFDIAPPGSEQDIPEAPTPAQDEEGRAVSVPKIPEKIEPVREMSGPPKPFILYQHETPSITLAKQEAELPVTSSEPHYFTGPISEANYVGPYEFTGPTSKVFPSFYNEPDFIVGPVSYGPSVMQNNFEINSGSQATLAESEDGFLSSIDRADEETGKYSFFDNSLTKNFDPKLPKQRNVQLPKAFHVITTSLLLGVIGITVFYVASFVNFSQLARQSLGSIQGNLAEAQLHVEQLDPQRAISPFESIQATLDNVSSKGSKSGLFALASLTGEFLPKLKEMLGAFGTFKDLNGSVITVLQDLGAIQKNGFGWMMNNDGELLISRLRNIEKEIDESINGTESLERLGELYGNPLGAEYSILPVQLSKIKNFLNVFTNWLDTAYPQHFLVFFHNPSELRPGGGFIGSYADVTIERGSVLDIDVVDIYDPDGQLDFTIVPPKQLQTITTDWGARDANWFFDFPTSADKVIGLLEKSKIYQEQLRIFDGALGINVRVIESILSITGPITLPAYQMTLDHENFLEIVQREVETGRDKKNNEPKKILKELTPLLLARMQNLDQSQLTELAQLFGAHIKRRDLMLYFKDPVMQAHIHDIGLAGDVYETPQSHIGDYLAVVHANVASGKTDVVIDQDIVVTSTISMEGKVENDVLITRTHKGGGYEDAHYNNDNRSYTKVFTPRGSELNDLTGLTARRIREPIDYERANYTVDGDLWRVESSVHKLDEFDADKMDENGKTVYGGWFYVDAGEKSTLNLKYTNPVTLPINSRVDIPYEFIFERQSGAAATLSVTIKAPMGYVFAETEGTVYSERFNDPPGRLKIPLTLTPLK